MEEISESLPVEFDPKDGQINNLKYQLAEVSARLDIMTERFINEFNAHNDTRIELHNLTKLNKALRGE